MALVTFQLLAEVDARVLYVKTFQELNDELPYVESGDKHSIVVEPYEDVRCKFPGKYASKTAGGDFVVETYTNGKWIPLRHKDYFRDIERKSDIDQSWTVGDLIPWYLEAISDTPSKLDIPETLVSEPEAWPDDLNWTNELGYQTPVIVRTLQLIAVAEHRRYAKYEPEGGRFLLPRFLIGIACGCWTADEANYYLKVGKPGLDKLRSERGYREPTFEEVKKGNLI